MREFFKDFQVLSEAISYRNLSAAASNIGLSQPQLSRIISRLEEKLQAQLLDRSARRKSSWTPKAYQLSEIYQKHIQKLEVEIGEAVDTSLPTSLRIGALDGLIPLAMEYGKKLIEKVNLQTLELDIYDLSPLETAFFNFDLDFIFTCREPGRKKLTYIKQLGYQTLNREGSQAEMDVLSAFEYRTLSATKRKQKKCFVSNSLSVRQQWMQLHGGQANVPSEIYPQAKNTKEEAEVILVAQDNLNPKIWEFII